MAVEAFRIEADPALSDIQYLEDRLYEFNAAVTGITDGQYLAILVRDESGKIVAGIAGDTWGACCEIKQLWIAEPLRKQGLGSRLLAAAEDEARRRECTQIVVATHSFQAPAFYIKHGFRVLAAVENQPRGHQHILLTKEL